jgi:hypothetical protein
VSVAHKFKSQVRRFNHVFAANNGEKKATRDEFERNRATSSFPEWTRAKIKMIFSKNWE